MASKLLGILLGLILSACNTSLTAPTTDSVGGVLGKRNGRIRYSWMAGPTQKV